MSVDDPAATERRRQIIASKPFLRSIYCEWYRMLASAIPPGTGAVLELGSGAGFFASYVPDLITSDLFYSSGVRIGMRAEHLAFKDASLRAIIFTNVLHHIPNTRLFFAEACRCLRAEGKIVMVEPWVSHWSRFVYRHFHHEPFDPDSEDWSFASTGPLSGANGAIPWILFERDRDRFEAEFPQLSIEQVTPFMPFRYLLSGGVGMRCLIPNFSNNLWIGFENCLKPWMSQLGMFAMISLSKKGPVKEGCV